MRRARPLLGTTVEIAADGSPPKILEPAMSAAFDAVARVHRLMSFHERDSDLSRINRYGASEAIPVDPWTVRVLRRAKALFEASGGLFDCVVGYELMRCGRLPGRGLDHVVPGTSDALILLPGDKIKLSAPVAIDLGGIAKGFAVDRAITLLRHYGVRNALVNAGGDIRVMGAQPQPIYVRGAEPRAVSRLAGLLQSGAIATSSPAATIERDGSGRDYPKGEPPRTSEVLYSVVAPTCLIADALTKVLIQTGQSDHPCFVHYGAKAFMTFADGRVR